MSAGATRAFRYLRRPTLVATEAAGHLEWLRDCLEPHFRTEMSHEGGWRVAFEADPDRFREVTAEGRHASGETLPFFALDSRIVSLPRWNSGGADATVAYDEEFDVFYTIRPNRCEVDVLAPSVRPWHRVALLRVVRELAMEEAVAGDGVFLHAAAFERDGIVYVVAGPKHAGKTTLLIHALTSEETRFVANDRVLLVRSTHGHAVRGMPTLVNVRAGTRRLFARHFDAYGFCPDSGCLTREERETEWWRAPVRFDEGLTLNPRQFADALAVASSTGGRLGAILFPVVSSAVEDIALDALSPATARELLASALFPTLERYGSATAFGSRAPSSTAAQQFLADVESRRIPMLRCALGSRAYERGAGALLDELSRWSVA